ncbi:MAG: 50S ribosomal protein L25 [Acidimicrobiales bacterium]
MSQTVVSATTDRPLGSSSSRRLRATGKLPAVLYGLGKDPVTVAVDYAELRDALKAGAGLNTVLELDMAGNRETAIIRDVQRDPIRLEVTHVDFLRVDTNQPVRVQVPIHLVGEATEVAEEGGMVEQILFELEIEVRPLDIPGQIDADISGLTIHGPITVADLPIPAGATLLTDEDHTVVAANLPSASIAEEAEVEAEEGEGGAEETGEAGDGDGDEAAADD